LFLEGVVIQDLDVAHGLLSALGLDTTLFCDEFLERFKVSTAIVVDRLGAWLAVKPFQRWEALNTKAFAEVFVGVGVDVGN